MNHSFGKLKDQDPLVWSLFGHAAFQYLHAGVKLGVFSLLAESPGIQREGIASQLSLQDTPLSCLLLGLTATGMICKSGPSYSNGHAIDRLFQKDQWRDFVNIIEFEAHLAYIGETDLVESLRSGLNIGLQRIKGSGPDLYHRLKENPGLQSIFFRYMRSWTSIAMPAFLGRVDLSGVKNAVDVGGGDATAAVAIARANPEIKIEVFELEENAELARRNVAINKLSDRVNVTSADFFQADFPTDVDCFFFIHQLVIWPLNVVKDLLRRAYHSLRHGGQVVILNSMVSDTNDGPLSAALDTAYFLSLPTVGGRIYRWADFELSLEEVGFSRHKRIALGLWTAQGAIIAEKD